MRNCHLLRNCQTGDVKYRKSIFSSLADIFNLDDEWKTNVAQYLKKPECEFKTYFPEISRDDLSLARNPFRLSSVKDELQNRFIDMKKRLQLSRCVRNFPSHGFLGKNDIVLSRNKQNCSKKAIAIRLYMAMRISFSTLLNVKTSNGTILKLSKIFAVLSLQQSQELRIL